MAVTSQQIADAAGVSRATVDRALKNRGRVKPEVAERIKKIAKEMGYQPNQAARALALTKNPVRIGMIIQSGETPFMQDVLKGVSAAREEIERQGGGVEVRCIKGINTDEVIRHMEEMRAAGINGIALVPSEDSKLKEEINILDEKHQIPVVTVNSDVSGSRRICFVGQDNTRAGRAAAGLMAESMEADGKVGIVTGSASNPALNSRVRGFREELAKLRPDIRIADTYYTKDDDNVSEQAADRLLEEHPETGGIYISAPAVSGICNALYKRGLAESVKVVANDVLDENIHNLERGAINFLIGQVAHVQGYEPVMILFRYLVGETKPEKEHEHTEIIIKTKYNI